MAQPNHEILRPPRRFDRSRLLPRAFREPLAPPFKPKGLALLSVLTLAVAVAAATVPTLSRDHAPPVDETRVVVTPGQSAPSGEANGPGSLVGPIGSADWALAEGGLYGSSVLPSDDVVRGWAWAEGRYYWSTEVGEAAGKRHCH